MEGNVRTTVHKSVVFEEWSDHLTATIGHHSSTPLSPEIPFSATMKVFEWDEVSVVQLSGSSSIRLHRHQPDDRVVIWLPVEGWVQERVNGEMRCAEPGTAMVFLPGDELVGETSRSLCGTSLILPRSRFGNLDSWKDCANRHISEGSEAISLLECAHELAEAFISDSSAKQHLVKALADQLLYWRICQYPHPEDNSYRPSERRAVIASAREWMGACPSPRIISHDRSCSELTSINPLSTIMFSRRTWSFTFRGGPASALPQTSPEDRIDPALSRICGGSLP
jgi:hypothetical protein